MPDGDSPDEAEVGAEDSGDEPFTVRNLTGREATMSDEEREIEQVAEALWDERQSKLGYTAEFWPFSNVPKPWQELYLAMARVAIAKIKSRKAKK